jgi:DNA gyrase subunit A
MVGAVQVFAGDELMLISNQGTLVRTRADEVSVLSRNTQGVRVIKTKDGESLVGVQRIDEPTDQPEVDIDTVAVTYADTVVDIETDADSSEDGAE